MSKKREKLDKQQVNDGDELFTRISYQLIDKLCLFIEMNGMIEGVLRIPGDKEEAQKLVDSFKNGLFVDLHSCIDKQSVTSALKLYLRKQSVSLFGNSPKTLQIISVISASSNPDVLEVIDDLLDEMPHRHKMVLRRLLEMLQHIVANHTVTKMTPSNLS